VPEAVVHRLEVVEIEQQHGDGRSCGGGSARERLSHSIGEEDAIREVRERVVERLVRHCRELFPFRDVAEECVDPLHALARALPDAELHRELDTVAGDGAQLERAAQRRTVTRAEKRLESPQVRRAVALGNDRVRDRQPDRLVPAPAERLLGHAVPLDDESVRVHAHEGVARGLDDRAEAVLARLQLLLHGASLGDVVEDAAPDERPVVGGDDRRGVADPAAVTGAREEPILGLVELTGRVRRELLFLRDDGVTIAGMELPDPEVGLRRPLRRGEAEHLLDARADVPPPATRAELRDVDDPGSACHDRLEALLGATEPTGEGVVAPEAAQRAPAERGQRPSRRPRRRGTHLVSIGTRSGSL